MNSDDNAMDSVSDLELTLGPSGRCIQETSNDESGVGANAVSRTETTFAANNPLCELVWSPHRGLSMRCPIGSVPEKKSSIFSDAGPSDMVYLPPYSIVTESGKDKLANERNSITLPTIAPVAKDDSKEATKFFINSERYAGNAQTCKSDFGCDPGSNKKAVEINTSSNISNAQESMVDRNSLREEDMVCQGNTIGVTEATESNSPGLRDGRTRNVLPISDKFDVNTRPVDLMPGGLNNAELSGSLDINEDNGQTHQLSLINGSLSHEVIELRKSMATDALILNPPSQCQGHIQPYTAYMEDSQNKKTACAFPLERLETIYEKKLQPVVKLVSDYSVGIRTSLQGEKEQFQLELGEVSKASPIRALASERKGKEKVVYDRDMNERASGEDCDSYGSAESCNSAGLLGAGKRRVLNFEEQVIAGHKRVKLQIQEPPGSTSFTRSGGSFTNWISTMIKGLSRPNEDSSLSHASDGSKKKGLLPYSREQDNKCGTMGFQSLFQSLSRSIPKVQDQRMLIFDNPQTSGSCKEHEVAEEPSQNNNTAKTSSLDYLPVLEQKMVSNDSLNQSVLASGQDLPTLLKGAVDSLPFDSKTSAFLKRFSSARSSAVAGEVGLQDFSVKKRKTDSGGDNSFGHSSEEKLVDDSVKERNQLGHLWMSHFCPKSSGPITNSADCKQGAVGVLESSADLSGPAHNPKNPVDGFQASKDIESQGHSSEEPKGSSCKTLHSFSLDPEVTCATKRIEGQKVNPIDHSHRFKSSEAIASIFTKRLDALKYFLPTDLADKATSSASTCFFCGIIGHDLRDCPQVTKTEVDELLRNITAFDEAEESPSLCIRCFQLNHWAVACPNAPSIKKNLSEHGDLWHQTGFERNLKLQDGTDSQTRFSTVKAGCASSPGCYIPPRMSFNLDVNLEINESPAWMRRISPNFEKVDALRDEENASETPCISRPCSSFVRQVLDKPSRIFEAVKSLRLSRADILKWMYSAVSISHLDGYYLRLRLGKLSKDLQGTGYHVACISGLEGEKSAEISKEGIPVIVGGIRYDVESQYISNQDFLEDELMTWWSTMTRGGGRVPLEDELWAKVEERRRLGL